MLIVPKKPQMLWFTTKSRSSFFSFKKQVKYYWAEEAPMSNSKEYSFLIPNHEWKNWRILEKSFCNIHIPWFLRVVCYKTTSYHRDFSFITISIVLPSILLPHWMPLRGLAGLVKSMESLKNWLKPWLSFPLIPWHLYCAIDHTLIWHYV